MIHILSGDSRFMMTVEKAAFRGIVHSLFHRTLNIRCSDSGELFTVACRELDNAPNTLIADFDHLQAFRIAIGDEVYCSKDRLHIGDEMALAAAASAKWTSVLPAYPADPCTLRINLITMKRYMEQFGKGGGMKRAAQPRSHFEEEVARLLQERSAALLDELAAGHRENAIQAAQSLVGLGFGLTPSGDDFLVGLFAVLNLPGNPFNEYSALGQEIIRRVYNSTNEISMAALKQSACGQVRESIVKLIDALAYGSQDDVISCLSSVLDIGSSSGTDIARGIYSGLQLCCQYDLRRQMNPCQ